MQQTLSQLSALNNDAIAESARTAQKLSDVDEGWVDVEKK
jgi:golgin subfamily A member 4